jgi:F-box interacting protein
VAAVSAVRKFFSVFCLEMEAEIWQRLPEELLCMVLAKLPMRVLGKMRTVCKQWNYLLSLRDALQRIVPNWSLHSTLGFLIEIHWDWNDMEYWAIEGRGSDVYTVPLLNYTFVDTCKGIFCCHRKGDPLDLFIGIPGTRIWRHLPRPPTPIYFFSGMAFDSSTRRCTLLLGYYSAWRGQQGQHDNRRIEMCIYDSESNAWNVVSMMVPHHFRPWGKGIYSKGKFYWAADPRNSIVAFNIADGLWTEIPPPEGRTRFFIKSLGEYYGQVVLVEQPKFDCIRIWKLNEEQKYEIWCELSSNGLTKPLFRSLPNVTVNSSGLIMIIDWKINVYIFNSKGELIVRKMRLPGLRRSQRPLRASGSAFESNNLWWP